MVFETCKISGSKSSKIEVIRHAIIQAEKNNYKYDLIIDLDVTSPLRTIGDITNSFKQFKKINNLFSVSEPRKKSLLLIL